MACSMLRSTLMRSPSWISSQRSVTRSFSSTMICSNNNNRGRSNTNDLFDFNVAHDPEEDPEKREDPRKRPGKTVRRQQRRQQNPKAKSDPRKQKEDADTAKLEKLMQPNWHPFRFNFSPESKEIVLHTGMVPHSQIAEVRKQILLHTDFSEEIQKINRKQNPVEAYFLRLVASGLGKNNAMTVLDKQNIMSTIRKNLQEK